LKDIIDLIFRVRAGSYSIEASNPCHEHEWRVFEEVKLPEGATLVPGVVGHCTDFIEHPDLVAERLVRYANLVGRENVLAGTDCGLGTRVGHPSVCWPSSQRWPKARAAQPRSSGDRRRFAVLASHDSNRGGVRCAEFGFPLWRFLVLSQSP
jgi:hypothetical protein